MRQVRARLEGRAGAGVGQPVAGPAQAAAARSRSAPPAPSVASVAAPRPGRHDQRPGGRRSCPLVTTRTLPARARRPVRGRVPAPAGHGDPGAGRAGHRDRVRRHGRQPRDDGGGPGGADPAASPCSRCRSRSARPTCRASSPPGCATPRACVSPAVLLALGALVVVVIAETRAASGRQPRDPSGTDDDPRGDGARVRRTATWPGRTRPSMRLTVLLGLVANLFAPWGIATTATWPGSRSARSPSRQAGGLAAVVGAAEVFLAKMRLFRVPSCWPARSCWPCWP